LKMRFDSESEWRGRNVTPEGHAGVQRDRVDLL
jgi:hypothetical protein